MAPAAPPPSPQVAAQSSPEQAQSVFAVNGLGQPGQPAQGGGAQASQQVMAKVQELDAWAADMKNLLGGFDPSLMPILEQIARAGMQLANSVQEKAQRSGMSRGSPVVPPTPPQNPGAPPPNPNGM